MRDDRNNVLEKRIYNNINKKIKLKKDLIIPKGTVFSSAPKKILLQGDDHYESVFGLSCDSSGSVRYCIADMDNFDEWFE